MIVNQIPETPKVRVKYVGKTEKNIGRWQNVRPGTVLVMTDTEAQSVEENDEFQIVAEAKGKPAQGAETK